MVVIGNDDDFAFDVFLLEEVVAFFVEARSFFSCFCLFLVCCWGFTI